jgi:hypothetical protein
MPHQRVDGGVDQFRWIRSRFGNRDHRSMCEPPRRHAPSRHTQPIEDRLAVAVLRTFGRFETNLSININAEPMRHMLKDEARNRVKT